MSWIAVAIGGSAILGAVTSSNSSRSAAAAQSDAANSANATQLQMFNTQREDAAPWRAAGGRALAGLEDKDFQRDFTMSDFQADPGYDFRMKEGMKAIERSAAARGGRHGGATMKALLGYGQDVASSEYQNAYNRFNADRDRRFNRLGSIAGVGQTANSQVAAAGQNYANQFSQNTMGAGNASAAASIAHGNSMNNLLGQGLTAGLMYAGGSPGGGGGSTGGYNSPIGEGSYFGGSGVRFSDERLKTEIKPVTKDDLKEMKAKLKAYTFKYKSEIHGRGEFIGVMAQDLEKSKLGKTLVFEDNHGHKQIDLARVLMLFLATMAEA